MNRRFILVVVSATLLLALASVSYAATGMYTDRSLWETAVPTWADVDLSPYAEYDALTSVALPPLALPATQLGFDITMQVRDVGSSWATWSGGYTPRVLFTGDTDAPLTGTFDAGVVGFGMEIEPNTMSDFDLSWSLSSGESLTQTVSGYAGAKFFGYWGDTGVTGWTVSGYNESGVAIGRMVVAPTRGDVPTPEPATLVLLACSGLAGFVLRRRREE